MCAEDRAPHRVGVERLNAHLLWPDEVRWSVSPDDPSLPGAIPDIDLVLPGHTRRHLRWARPNVVCIDTGVHEEEYGHLAVAEVQDGLELHRFERTELFR